MTETLQRLKDEDWVILVDRIKGKACTPFLGPGVCSDGFERRAAISQILAARYQYPLDDSGELERVSRFVSVKYNVDFARSRLLEEYDKFPTPNFKDESGPHGVLANLPIPVYITTTHDDFMMQALKKAEKDPHQELCRWKRSINNDSDFLGEGKEPTPANPIVFHLYGHPQTIDRSTSLESLVLTEDDYFEFLINVSGDDDAIPLRMRRAMAGTSLLFLGYRLDDWDFRVLFHLLLAKYLRVSADRTHVAVQVPIDEAKPEEQRKKVQDYLNRYIASKRLDIRVYWGTSQEFTADLKAKWEAFE